MTVKQILIKENLLSLRTTIHNFVVCDDHAFKDQMLFYRFRRDDGSSGFDNETKLVFEAIDLYNR